MHIGTHTKKNLISCLYCKKTFTTNKVMKEHAKIQGQFGLNVISVMKGLTLFTEKDSINVVHMDRAGQLPVVKNVLGLES